MFSSYFCMYYIYWEISSILITFYVYLLIYWAALLAIFEIFLISFLCLFSSLTNVFKLVIFVLKFVLGFGGRLLVDFLCRSAVDA